MLTRRLKGTLAEAKAVAELIRLGYEVFLPFADGAPYDMVALKGDKLLRVSVKFTAYEPRKASWEVTLKNVSRRNDSKIVVKKFSPKDVDMLIVYVQPEDRIVIIDPTTLKNTNALSLKKRRGD